MLKKTLLGFVILLAIFLSGCSLSDDDVSSTVLLSMNEKFSSDPNFKTTHLVVKKVTVFKESDVKYKGLVSVESNGRLHDIAISINVSGNNVMWEASSDAMRPLFSN